ncbi:hypothetical protein TREES_T100018758 [Tupaia chinensis]|uniref:Uncharacterized protein n=1 Tax=Tupaia chinensis TaxID=246437 RepID=L9KHR7_TUPCH|nr:hypothetical protein TREES_T100018758 [Tupaia chinensis]
MPNGGGWGGSLARAIGHGGCREGCDDLEVIGPDESGAKVFLPLHPSPTSAPTSSSGPRHLLSPASTGIFWEQSRISAPKKSFQIRNVLSNKISKSLPAPGFQKVLKSCSRSPGMSQCPGSPACNPDSPALCPAACRGCPNLLLPCLVQVHALLAALNSECRQRGDCPFPQDLPEMPLELQDISGSKFVREKMLLSLH